MTDEDKIAAYEVSVADTPWRTIINTTSRGKAKSDYYRDVTECYPNVPYTAMRARKIGPPHTSEAFEMNALYRGKPEARCGSRVRMGEAVGTIVGHNSSANFDVLFDEDSPKYPGERLNCHPDRVTILPA